MTTQSDKEGTGARDNRWYLSIMSPNTKGEKFAWLDPTSIYINSKAYSDLLDDLITDLESVEFDVVAGLDAMGFVLGAGLAARRNVGFLPIRKAGKLCVDTDSVEFGNYSGRLQNMEMRTPAFPEGTKVLLADQWVETGGKKTSERLGIANATFVSPQLFQVPRGKLSAMRNSLRVSTSIRPKKRIQTQGANRKAAT